MKTCPFCKEEVRDDAIRCRHCQSFLLTASPPASLPDDGRHVTYVLDRDLVRFGKFSAAVLAVFVVVGAYLFGFKLEASVEKVSKLQTEVEKASDDLKRSQAELQAAKTTVGKLQRDVEDLLAQARRSLGEIHEQRDVAIAAVVSIKKLNPTQVQTLSQAKSAKAHKTRSTGKYWAVGATIRVAFMGGSDKQREIVTRTAVEWTKYANIHFEFVDSGSSDVRIAFEPSNGSWSFVGTDALGVAKDAPTMNLGWLERQNVLHEFGHALGLIEEHQNPKANIKWNRDEVIRHLSGPPNLWSLQAIEDKVFKKLPPEQVGAYREFDPKSVMTFSFPPELTGGMAIGGGSNLSESDKEFIGRLYPKR